MDIHIKTLVFTADNELKIFLKIQLDNKYNIVKMTSFVIYNYIYFNNIYNFINVFNLLKVKEKWL